MDAVDIARWQFAIVTIYHYFFVPVTIGLSVIVAAFETAWLRHRNPEMLRLTKFFGKLFTINFALRSGHRDRPGVPVRNELE